MEKDDGNNQWLWVFKNNILMAKIVPILDFKSLFRLLTATCSTLRHRITHPDRMPARLTQLDKERYKTGVMAWRNMFDMPSRIFKMFHIKYKDTPTHSALTVFLKRLRIDSIEMKHPTTHKYYQCYGGCGKKMPLNSLMSRDFVKINMCFTCATRIRHLGSWWWSYNFNFSNTVLGGYVHSRHFDNVTTIHREWVKSLNCSEMIEKKLLSLIECDYFVDCEIILDKYYPHTGRASGWIAKYGHFYSVSFERLARNAKEHGEMVIERCKKNPKVRSILDPPRENHSRKTKRARINYKE